MWMPQATQTTASKRAARRAPIARARSSSLCPGTVMTYVVALVPPPRRWLGRAWLTATAPMWA